VPSQLQIERTALVEQLKQLEIIGQKFRPGSPKTRHNKLDQANVSRKIAELDRQIEALAASQA
jgi:hypothetical protein